MSAAIEVNVTDCVRRLHKNWRRSRHYSWVNEFRLSAQKKKSRCLLRLFRKEIHLIENTKKSHQQYVSKTKRCIVRKYNAIFWRSANHSDLLVHFLKKRWEIELRISALMWTATLGVGWHSFSSTNRDSTLTPGRHRIFVNCLNWLCFRRKVPLPLSDHCTYRIGSLFWGLVAIQIICSFWSTIYSTSE